MKSHWENIYRTKEARQVSWYQPHLTASLQLILNLDVREPLIDIGGGASTLAEDLLKAGLHDITVLDISRKALEISQKRLGQESRKVKWMEGDITRGLLPAKHYAVWHDRAVFHFLTSAEERKKYIENLVHSLKEGGHAILAAFSLQGPLKCSGLDIVRYSPPSLQAELGSGFELVKSFSESHQTPFNATQDFIYCLFKKTSGV